jgi:Rhodopirellula transposase DDE domain
MGQRWHRPRHGFIRRQRQSTVVVDDGKEALRQGQAHADHRGRWWQHNGYRVRLWKVELQKLADELKIPITVCHFPPGTSKWNKIEHRLFSFITINWRGKPLRTYRTIVQLIAATTTEAGLTVRAELDEKKYPKGVKVSDAQLAAVNLTRHSFHGDWNYTIAPRRRTN